MSSSKLNGRLTRALAAVRRRTLTTPADRAERRDIVAALFRRDRELTAGQDAAIEQLLNGSVRPDAREILAELEDTGTFTQGERRLIEAAMRDFIYLANRETPVDDPDLVKAIAEAAAIVATHERQREQALDALTIATITERRTPPNDPKRAVAVARVKTAEMAVRNAATLAESARTTLADLQEQRAAARRVATSGR